MGNRTDEDYNFVFKGKLGISKRENPERVGERLFPEETGSLFYLYLYLGHSSPNSAPSSAFLLGEKGHEEYRQV